MIKAIKAAAGADFPVIYKYGLKHDVPGGREEAEGVEIAPHLEEAGADAIMVRNHWLGYHVAGFLPDYLFYPEAPVPLNEIPPEYYWRQRGAAANLYLAEGLKSKVSIPITVVGKISPEMGEKILRQGKADFIGMHRALMSDPELPKKIANDW